MMTPILFALLGLFQRGLQVQPQPNNSAISTTGASNATNQGTAFTCMSDLRWINSNLKIFSLASPITINLFSAVGAGCAPAELRVSAIYLDTDENVICSGVVESVAGIDQNTGSTILEFRPVNLLEFVRWRNGLRPAQPAAKRLVCIGPDQLLEVSREETDRASSVRLYVTLLPRNGGLSNLEIKLDPRH